MLFELKEEVLIKDEGHTHILVFLIVETVIAMDESHPFLRSESIGCVDGHHQFILVVDEHEFKEVGNVIINVVLRNWDSLWTFRNRGEQSL